MKKIICLILCVVMLATMGMLQASAAITSVSNDTTNAYGTYTLAVGTQSTINGYLTWAYTDSFNFWASVTLGKLSTNSLKRVVCADIYGPEGYTRKFKLVTKKSSNTDVVVDSLSKTTLGTGVNVDTNESYVEKQATYLLTVVCDAQLEALKSSSVGYRAYPSITVAI